jgi:hypothetical protein
MFNTIYDLHLPEDLFLTSSLSSHGYDVDSCLHVKKIVMFVLPVNTISQIQLLAVDQAASTSNQVITYLRIISLLPAVQPEPLGHTRGLVVFHTCHSMVRFILAICTATDTAYSAASHGTYFSSIVTHRMNYVFGFGNIEKLLA